MAIKTSRSFLSMDRVVMPHAAHQLTLPSAFRSSLSPFPGFGVMALRTQLFPIFSTKHVAETEGQCKRISSSMKRYLGQALLSHRMSCTAGFTCAISRVWWFMSYAVGYECPGINGPGDVILTD